MLRLNLEEQNPFTEMLKKDYNYRHVDHCWHCKLADHKNKDYPPIGRFSVYCNFHRGYVGSLCICSKFLVPESEKKF